MRNLFTKLRLTSVKLTATIAVAAAVVALPAALHAWGPDRPTFTGKNPADYVTFNSITDNPDVGDERNFVRIKEDTSTSTFEDNVTLQPGKVYEVMAYYHNNAKDSLNESGKGIAKDTTLKMEVPGVVKAGVNAAFTGTISASNAKPVSVWDEAYGKNATSADVALRYVSGSAKVKSNGAVNGQTLPDSLFTTGAKLGYNALDGTLPGCNKYAGYVTFKIRVDQPNFTVKKEVSTDGKTWTKTASAQPGATVSYRITYQNTGTSQQDHVTALDTLPTGVSYVAGSSLIANSSSGGTYRNTVDGITVGSGYDAGSYQPKGNFYFKFQAKLPTGDKLVCGTNTLKNVARVTTSGGSKDDDATVTVNKECKPPVAKYTCDALSVQKLSRTSFKFSTAYTVENATLKSIVYVVRDNQGNEIYRGTDATYNQQRVGSYTVQSYVTVTVDGNDKTVTSDNCKKSFEVTKEKENTPGVSIEKKVDGVEHKKVAVNEEYTYQLVVKNTGEVDLKNVVVRDPAPKNVQFISADKGTITNNVWTYTIPELKIGASQTFAIKAKVTAETAGNIVNTACVDAPEVPGNPDDCDTATVEVPPKTTGQIKVCDLTTKQVVFIDESDYDETKYTTDLSKCAEEEELPSELPVTGAADIVAKLAGVVSLAGATTYYIASRRNS